MNEVIFMACKQLIDDAKMGCADLVFTKTFPPCLKTLAAISSDRRDKSICLAWSTSQTPEILGETSESTTSATERGKKPRTVSTTAASFMSQMIDREFSASSGSISSTSTP